MLLDMCPQTSGKHAYPWLVYYFLLLELWLATVIGVITKQLLHIYGGQKVIVRCPLWQLRRSTRTGFELSSRLDIRQKTSPLGYLLFFLQSVHEILWTLTRFVVTLYSSECLATWLDLGSVSTGGLVSSFLPCHRLCFLEQRLWPCLYSKHNTDYWGCQFTRHS